MLNKEMLFEMLTAAGCDELLIVGTKQTEEGVDDLVLISTAEMPLRARLATLMSASLLLLDEQEDENLDDDERLLN